MSLRNVRVVLVRPRGAANVGAVARAMKNMGLSDLTLVRPGRLGQVSAAAWAVHALDVLRARRTVASLDEAVADCALVVGTTNRRGPYRSHARSPREAAGDLVARAGVQRVALVFGPEDHGLSNEDLKCCHQLLTIPASAQYSSLNLAQAVMICAYELRLAAPAAGAAEVPNLASAQQVDLMYRRLQQALLRIGFLHGDNPDHIMYALRELFGRTGLEEREVNILLGMARQIEWFAAGGWRQRSAAGPPLK